MEFIITVLTVYGISAIVTISKIFAPIRDWADKFSPDFWSYLVKCMQCFPFWAGIFVSFILGPPLEVNNELFPNALNLFFTYLLSGALLSGTTMLIHVLTVNLMGDNWKQHQERELNRKIKKGIVKE